MTDHVSHRPAPVSLSRLARSDAVHRNQLLEILPQLNPIMSKQHFDQLMDQMFAGFKVGGDMGIMTSAQVLLAVHRENDVDVDGDDDFDCSNYESSFDA